MWRSLHISTESDSSFAQSNTEIARLTFRNIVLVTSGFYLAWHLVATLSWPASLGLITWAVTTLFALLVALVLRLGSRRFPAAQWVWPIGLALVVTLALYLYRQPEIAFCLALLPFMAAVTVSWHAGLIVELVVAALAAWLAYGSPDPMIPTGYAIAIGVVGAFAALVGWSSSHALYTVIQWAIFSFNQARENMDEARDRRAQLARVVKDLDQAYQRLERANAALIAAWRAADDAERFKAEFVANVSHELRTPLNLIVGFSEMIMTAPENYGGAQIPGPYRSDLNAIYHNAQHLLALVDDVLDLARIEAGRIAVARDQVNMNALVGEALDMVRDYVAAKGLDLQVEINPGLPDLWIDRLRIRQVLLNLLVNAARFTERGSIRIEVAQQESEILVRISDTGKGIPREDLPKIFDEFHSTQQPVSSWHSSTGLGLPISRKFVELHHGRMGVESTYLQGSTFWFTLPCSIAPAEHEAGRWVRTPQSRRVGDSERIVVAVHEDRHVAPLLQRHLDGYRVVGASDLDEGARLVDELKAIALIVDPERQAIQIPDHTPVIRCPLPSGQRTALALGAYDLLVKPVSHQELASAIERLGHPVKRVLIADDDPDVARLFRRMLRNRVSECLEAHNGREALDLVATHAPDLIILDLMMPEVSGQEVLSSLGADPQLAQIPVLLVTAREQAYIGQQLIGPIQVAREGGFQLGEMVRMVGAMLNALSPGWQ